MALINKSDIKKVVTSNIPVLNKDKYFKKDIEFRVFYAPYPKRHVGNEGRVLHKHEFTEIALVVSGTGYHLFGSSKYHVKQGDLFIINPNTPHVFWPEDDENSSGLKIINCMFSSEFIKGLNIEFSLLGRIMNILVFSSIYDEEANSYFGARLPTLSPKCYNIAKNILDRMIEYYEHLGEEENKDALKILLCDYLILIYKAHKHEMTKWSSKKKDNYEPVEKAIQYINEGYAEKITIESIAQYTCLSDRQLIRIFKEVTGKTIVDYIQSIRINKAKQLLLTTSEHIYSISTSVGYNNDKYFREVFKRITGLTPQQYRKLFR